VTCGASIVGENFRYGERVVTMSSRMTPAVAAELGFSELTIAGLLGHRVPGITARHAHMPDRALLTAADQVSARLAVLLGEV
jgi:hypothetical protein